MPTPAKQPDPSSIPAFDRAMRQIVAVPKSELDAMRRKAPKRKPPQSKRKGK
jgi:hypothetical protein